MSLKTDGECHCECKCKCTCDPEKIDTSLACNTEVCHYLMSKAPDGSAIICMRKMPDGEYVPPDRCTTMKMNDLEMKGIIYSDTRNTDSCVYDRGCIYIPAVFDFKHIKEVCDVLGVEWVPLTIVKHLPIVDHFKRVLMGGYYSMK